jgi:hypothetical protein
MREREREKERKKERKKEKEREGKRKKEREKERKRTLFLSSLCNFRLISSMAVCNSAAVVGFGGSFNVCVERLSSATTIHSKENLRIENC